MFDKKTLYHLYYIENKTLKEIAEILGSERHTVSRYMKKYGIRIKKYRSKVSAPLKNELLKLYTVDMKSISEIGKIYGVGKKAVKKWLIAYEIDIIPNSQKKYYHVRKIPLTKQQKSITIGLMLGDGSMTHTKSKRISVGHGKTQLEYLQWIRKSMGCIFQNPIRKHEVWKWTNEFYTISSICHQDFNQIYDLFFDNNKKVIKNELINYIDDLALAVWFMDDGSSKKDKSGITYCSKFSTEGFSYKDHKILQDILRIKFGIRTKICEYKRYDKKYNYLSVNKNNAIKLTAVIEKHIPNCMRYKLVYDRSSTTKCQTPTINKDRG